MKGIMEVTFGWYIDQNLLAVNFEDLLLSLEPPETFFRGKRRDDRNSLTLRRLRAKAGS